MEPDDRVDLVRRITTFHCFSTRLVARALHPPLKRARLRGNVSRVTESLR
jgi:hypothetical protein